MKTSIIIPFLKGMDCEEELEVAIESWRKNLMGVEPDIFVIGDNPMIEGVTVIPMSSVESTDEKLRDAISLACMTEEIEDEFIVAQPNVFVANQIGMEHLQIIKSYPLELAKVDNKRTEDTLQLLNKWGLKASIITSLDLPIVVSKYRWTSIMETYPDIADQDLDFITLYLNLTQDRVVANLDWRSDCWLLPVINNNTQPEVLKKYSANKCFIACTAEGWNEAVQAWAEEQFNPVEHIKDEE